MYRYACTDALIHTYGTCDVEYALRHAQHYACSEARHYLCSSPCAPRRPPRVYTCNAWLGPHQVGMSMLVLLASNFHVIFNTPRVYSDLMRHRAHRGHGRFHGQLIVHTGQKHVDGSGGSLVAEFSCQSVYMMQRLQCCIMDSAGVAASGAIAQLPDCLQGSSENTTHLCPDGHTRHGNLSAESYTCTDSASVPVPE